MDLDQMQVKLVLTKV